MSVEALMRCNVKGKNIAPGRFFPVAEKSALIGLLGEWSLLQGARQAKILNASARSTTVSINVSRGQLSDVKFSKSLSAAIVLADVDPSFIELEFSESVFMEDSETIKNNLLSSRDMGINLAIDNFGSGFSRLSNIKNIPATKLKLGRALVSTRPDDERALIVLKAMVHMGKELGMKVIAEGVETKEQMETMRELSVDGIQGYYYARPMDVDALSSWISNREL